MPPDSTSVTLYAKLIDMTRVRSGKISTTIAPCTPMNGLDGLPPTDGIGATPKSILLLRRLSHAHEPLIEIRRDDGVERVETERANSYQLELENLSEAIRGEAEPLLGRADAVGNARTLEALYASAASG